MSCLEEALSIVFPKQEEVKVEIDMTPSQHLMDAMRIIELEEYKSNMIQLTIDRLVELCLELDFMDEVIKNTDYLMEELALNVVRYGGKDSPWYLCVLNGDYLAEMFEGCPPVSNYDLGSYFDRTENFEEAKRFILDRIKWAREIINREIEVVVYFYHAIVDWDCESDLPPMTSNELIMQATLPSP